MKKTFLLTFAVCLLFVGFGCKGLSAEEQASVRPVSIDYWTVFNNVDQLRAYAAEYTRTKPHVRINIRQVRFEEFEDRFVNALADDVAPDIISVHAKDVLKYQPRLSSMPRQTSVSNVYIEGKYVKETVVQPERNAMPTLSTIRQQYVSAVPADVIVDGSVYGLPMAVDTLALYYNKDLLDQANIPTPPATWGEFLESVSESTRVDGSDNILQSGVALGTGENIEYAPDILAMLMMQNGARVAEGGRVRFTQGLEQGVTEAPATEALRFYTDFARPTREAYSWNSTFDSAFDAFVRGQSVFYIGYAFDFNRIKGLAPQLNVDVVPLPQLNPAQPANVANYWVESVVAKSDQQDVAWDFVRFLTLPERAKEYSEANGQLSPFRAHVGAQSEIPQLAPFADQILNARNWYQGKNATVAEAVMTDLIENFLLPYPEDVKPEKRDADIIVRAARSIQQTL